MNYDKNIDFVVDFDNVWKWLGFQQKVKAISLLEKNFTIDIDYKKSAFPIGKAVSPKAVLDETKISVKKFKW